MATACASELLVRYAAILSRAQSGGARLLFEDGDGLLAAYDLFHDGLNAGWLTVEELRQAPEIARPKAFSKLSAGIERDAMAKLGKPR